LAFYEEAGLSLSEDFHELPDHIAAELEFLYFLTYREIEALQSHDLEKAGKFLNFQERFWGRFLRHWVPPFCGRIRDRSENRFYCFLADCLSSFLENMHTAASLRNLLGSPHAG
jgi:TorA maturation chaperone TorD